MEEFLHQRDRVGVQDFILLEDFTSPKSFIANLKKRFKEDLIYTSIGSVLVSVNPYQQLDIYNDKIIQTYRRVNFYELPPHIFAIADHAYRSMCTEQIDQCVLISGESGSGKTEASKKVLQYVAVTSTQSDDVGRIRDRLLQSNPILEAFGNAKTNCNDNSSRFGKYMDIQFNFKGAPIGGHIRNYLLEKSRVVHQASGERNFHIFYQLLASHNEKLLYKLSLDKPASHYFYLGQGESVEIDAVDDNKNFHDVIHALEICEFSQEHQQCLFAIIAFVLHLGDIEFTEENGHAIVVDPDSVHTFSKIIGCSFSKLLASLQSRTIETKCEKVVTPFNMDQAFYARDALAKNVYDRVFSWIVKMINASLDKNIPGKSTLMGLLDIYGFEIFTVNSFEQFCINYCNEKLQQLFIEQTLKSEQEEYFREGIEWEPVEYFDNQIICDLVENKTEGVIALLDEECLRPGDSSDASFLTKLTRKAGRHPHFVSHESTDSTTRKTITRAQFRLRHYAGDVTYNVDGFIDKNNDLFFRDLKEAMIQSRNVIMAECFPSSESDSRKRPLSAASQFKSSLVELMLILKSKEPSYVRCIKPNEHKKAGMFEDKNVLHQIKYLGLMENVRVRRAGFAYRRPYEVFLKRYKSLCPETWPHYRGQVREGVKVLVQYLHYDPHGYRLGKSKLFIKSPKVLFATEDAFQKRKHELATIIQSVFRCFRQQGVFKEMKASAVKVQSMWRRVSAKQKMESRKRAANHIRQFIKGFMMRKVTECEDNENFINITRRNYLMRLRRNLPHTVLDKSWLEPPELIKETSQLLRDLCMKNLTLKYVKQLDPLRKYQLEEKVVAESMFRYKKESYPYSVRDPFVPSRLASHHERMLEAVFERTIKNADEKVVYSSAVIKYDRHGYKARNRVLVVTDQTVYVLCAKDFKVKDKLPYNMIRGVLLSKLSDGLFVVVTKTDINENGTKGDIILHAEYVIEAVTKIAITGKLTNFVKVSSAYSIEHTLANGKLGVIDFTEGEEYTVKKAHGHHMSVCVPRVIYGPAGRSGSTPRL